MSFSFISGYEGRRDGSRHNVVVRIQGHGRRGVPVHVDTLLGEKTSDG